MGASDIIVHIIFVVVVVIVIVFVFIIVVLRPWVLNSYGCGVEGDALNLPLPFLEANQIKPREKGMC